MRLKTPPKTYDRLPLLGIKHSGKIEGQFGTVRKQRIVNFVDPWNVNLRRAHVMNYRDVENLALRGRLRPPPKPMSRKRTLEVVYDLKEVNEGNERRKRMKKGENSKVSKSDLLKP